MNTNQTLNQAQQLTAVSIPSKPMFLSDQFEAYLDVVEMELDGRTQRLVSLRSLHEKLGVKRQFTQWVKDALTNSRSTEGVHFNQVTRDLVREGRGTVKQHDYYACFEKTKIIAARSDAENSLDICEWLDQLMIQTAVAQAVGSVPVVQQPAAATPSEPLFLSDQFEAYLKLFDAVIGDREQRCVDAEELHSKLGVGKDFTTWIKSRLSTEQMEDGVDFTHTQTGVRGARGATQKSVYTLTLEAAKIIASMERNDAGRKIRKWLVQLMIQTAVAQAVSSVPVVQQPAAATPSEPIFLSDQFEAYLKVVEMELDGRTQRLVDLRSLHEKLGVKEHFKDWAPRSLTNSRSVEGVHYSPLVDQRAVPHSSGGTQRQVSKEYYTCFEKAKIIAARSNAENSLDICEWLVRVEDQVRQQSVQPNMLSEIETARKYLAALEREYAANEEKKRLQVVIATNTLYPKVEPEAGKAHISIKDIKREFAPYLSEPKIRLVLRFYGQGRTRFQFGNHENANVVTFQREGLEEVFNRFLHDAIGWVSRTGTTLVVAHECFDKETVRIPRDVAIQQLGYDESEFDMKKSES